MATTLKSLPASSQSFEDIIRSGAIYADKTKTLADLIAESYFKTGFLARPKGFGKTLMISTFEAIFSGDRDLFRGLRIERALKDEGLAPRPVIRLDIGRATRSEGFEEFKRSLLNLTVKKADDLGVATPKDLSPGEALDNLISRLGQESGRQIAILIDDYDLPLTDLGLAPWNDEVIALLSDYYGVIKEDDPRASFVLATGVSSNLELGKLICLSGFSDLTRFFPCGWICGFTHDDLERYFGAHVKAAAKSLKMTPAKLLDRMRSRYEGYWFNGVTGVYNPFSVLEFFKTKEFRTFWLDGADPDLVASLFLDNRLTVEEHNDESILYFRYHRSLGKFDYNEPQGLLYQRGYLGLRFPIIGPSPDSGEFILKYSNQDAYGAISRLWMAQFFESEEEAGRAMSRLRYAFVSRDPGAVAAAFNYYLARNPYDRYLLAKPRKPKSPKGEESPKDEEEPIPQQERFIRSCLLTIAKAADLEAQADIHSHLGRTDLMVKAYGLIWVFELEICQKAGEEKKTAEAVLAKIQERGLPEWQNDPNWADSCLGEVLAKTHPL
ncbi:MAG: ATP-binding protein, partial [Deltaproteobacteria bacterium]|nr:ATP-binding protein [Deltaproteobacteria bacterium]